MSTTTPNMSLKKAQDSDNARDYVVVDLGGSLDAVDGHDHSAGLGLPVKRILSGPLASRPSGTAGWAYFATDTKQLFCHDGTAWCEITPGPGSITSTHIADGTIVDADISTSAAIAQSKISNAVRAIDADKVDGYHAGNASGQVALSNGTVCTNLNADKVDGADAGNAANNVLKLDASGLVPLANIPTPLTGKDADTVDGSHASAFAAASDMSDFMKSYSRQAGSTFSIPTSWGSISDVTLTVAVSQLCDLHIYGIVQAVKSAEGTQIYVRAMVDSTPLETYYGQSSYNSPLPLVGHWYFGGVGAGTHNIYLQTYADLSGATIGNRRLSVIVVPK